MASKEFIQVPIKLGTLSNCYFDVPSVDNQFWANSGVPNVLDNGSGITELTNYDRSWSDPTATFAVTDSALDPVYYTDVPSGCSYVSSDDLRNFFGGNSTSAYSSYDSQYDGKRYLWLKVSQTKTIRAEATAMDTLSLFTITYPAICLGSIADILVSTGWTTGKSGNFPVLKIEAYVTSTSDELTVSQCWNDHSTSSDRGYDYRRAFSTSKVNRANQPPSINFPYLMVKVRDDPAEGSYTYISHTITEIDKGLGTETQVAVPLYYVASYSSSRTLVNEGDLEPEEEILGVKLSRDNINIIRFKANNLRLSNAPNNPVWSKSSVDYGMLIPVTLKPRHFWSWVRTANRWSPLSWRLPSLMSWQQVKDEGRLIIGKYSSGSLSYATRILIEPWDEASTTINELSYLLGAKQLVDFWTNNVIPLVNNNGEYQLSTDWKDYVQYKSEEVFPSWISVKAYTKTDDNGKLVIPEFTFYREESKDFSGTGATEKEAIEAAEKALETALMNADSITSDQIWDENLTTNTTINGSASYGNFTLGLVGDPRIPWNYDSEDRRWCTTLFNPLTSTWTATMTQARYRVHFSFVLTNAPSKATFLETYYKYSEKPDGSISKNWAGRTEYKEDFSLGVQEDYDYAIYMETFFDKVLSVDIISYSSLAQILPDPYHTAKSMNEWPVAIDYITVDRLASIGSKDNPNSYSLISLGTSQITVNSECDYYAFMPTTIGRYRFSADSDNAFIGYVATQVDNGTGLEVFGEATWADDGISFELNCAANKMVYIACSTADFSHDTYNLTIELVTD